MNSCSSEQYITRIKAASKPRFLTSRKRGNKSVLGLSLSLPLMLLLRVASCHRKAHRGFLNRMPAKLLITFAEWWACCCVRSRDDVRDIL